MAEPADINVDELRRRARRRLVGAVVLALGVAVVVPMLLETEQKPLGEEVAVKIPPIDDSRFDNRLAENRPKESGAPAKEAPAKEAPVKEAPAKEAPVKDAPVKDAKVANDAAPKDAASPLTTAPPPKYDTRVPAASAPGTAPATEAVAPDSTGAAAPPAEIHPAPATGDKPPAESAKSGTPAAQASRNDSKTAPTGAHPASPPTPPPHEGFAVQLAAFADDKGANALAGRLKKSGYTAYTEPLKTSKGTLWRVRVGPYPSRDAAVAARDKLKSLGQSGIVAAVK